MSREILFRGKRIDNGEWVYWNIFGELTEFICFQNEKWKSLHYDASKKIIEPTTIGPYTGLKDKNGTLVFCDDIILKQDGSCSVYGIVRYGDIPAITGNHKHIGFYIEWINDGANLWSEWWRNDIGYWVSKCLTAGNIYDNPELLEAQNETSK